MIGISESKLDNSVLSSEIHIDNYNTLRCDRNRHGGGVVCYIRNDLSYDVKSFFPPEIENIFFEILLPNTKPIIVGIIYRPPSQSEFLEIINTHFSKVDTNNNEIYILGNFNIKLYLTSDIKKYYEFCTMFDLKQLIEVPTCVTCSSSTVIDHILASFIPIESRSKVSLMLDFLITKLYTALEKSPESKEVHTNKLGAVR